MSNSPFGYIDSGSSNYSEGRILIIESQGKGFVVRGEYSSISTYQPGDVVLYSISSYVCKLSSVGNLPTDTNYFSLLCQGSKAFSFKGAYSSHAYEYYDIVTGADGDIYFCNNSSGATSADIPGIAIVWTKMLNAATTHSELSSLTTDDHTQYVLELVVKQ